MSGANSGAGANSWWELLSLRILSLKSAVLSRVRSPNYGQSKGRI